MQEEAEALHTTNSPLSHTAHTQWKTESSDGLLWAAPHLRSREDMNREWTTGDVIASNSDPQLVRT